jgi:hypothetical protein
MATLTVTGQPGYSGTINFSAASCSGLPRESTCSFNPAAVTSSGTTTLTVSTTAAHSARLECPAWWTTGFGTMAGIFLLGSGSRRRAGKRVLALIAVSCVVTIVGCGDGGGHSSGGNTDPGTPAGSSTVTVTAVNGTLTHTTTFTLTVQ